MTQQQIVIISLEVSAFGGYRRSTEQDIKEAGGKAPATEVLTKGGKHVFPPEKLAPFSSNKRDVIRNLSRFGVKAFKNGSVIAISDNDLQKAEEIIADGEAMHQKLVAELDANYDDWLDKYIQTQKVEVQTIIKRSALTKTEAISKFGYSHTSFIPTPVGTNASAESLQSGLVVQLYNELAQSAQELYDKSIAPEDSSGVRRIKPFGQKTKRPIVAAKEKLAALSFLHPGIVGGIELIEVVLNFTQTTGYIMNEVGNPANTRFIKLVELMFDAPRFRTASEKIADGNKDFASILGLATVSPAPQGEIFRPEAGEVVVVQTAAVKQAQSVDSQALAELAFF